MWIVGNSKSLNKSHNWKAILDTGVQQNFSFPRACDADQLAETLKQGPNCVAAPSIRKRD
jgi:hypothetical protein